MSVPLARRVGREDVSGRDLYLAVIDNIESWPADLEQPTSGFVALTALDTAALPVDEVRAFAQKVISQGCTYACAWGPGASDVHTAFDLALVDAEIAGTPYPEFVTTTSHEDESLDEAIWFAVIVAYPEEEVAAVLVITQPEWAAQVERRLGDTKALSNDVVEADEDL